MNRFANIIEAFRFRKVTYYTVQFKDEEPSLFLKFLNQHTDEKFQESIDLIRSWLSRIGDEVGAKSAYFRTEQYAHALPPPATFINVKCDLRLYCLRINSNIVILFDGAEKTAQTAQQCDNCRPVFNQANQLTDLIYKKIKIGEITIVPKSGELYYDENLTLEL